MHYFGTDKDAALAEYVRVKDDLEAGRMRRPKRDGGYTVADAINQFLTQKRDEVTQGELTAGTWGEYYHAAEQVIETFGSARLLSDLCPEDFGRLRTAASERLGLTALKKFVTLIRSIFGSAFANGLLDVPIRYGDRFDKPGKAKLKLVSKARGEKVITATDAWKLFDAADVQLRAMILLGLNCAFGQSDCARLTRTAAAIEPGWLDALRMKTVAERRCPLWPETVKALSAVAKVRPEPKEPSDADLVFLTVQGNRWVRHYDRGDVKPVSRVDTASNAFSDLAKKCGLTLPGGFYPLRQTFRTVADATKDQVAVRLVMGHSDPSIDDNYRHTIGDDRLLAVTDHVRAWLLAGNPK